MFLIDVNLLVYAANRTAPEHMPAKSWLEKSLVGRPQTVAFPWLSVLGFLRVVSNRKIYSKPISVVTAWHQIQRWLDAPAAWIPAPGPRHRYVIGELIELMEPGSGQVSDLHLAALAIENGLTLASVDSGFATVPRLRWVNPLTQR
jgi:uncharacterized protein